ncbi:hypothetical protein [Paraburkholderia bannensis]|uniref:hypothetical protein n=1 Tax=Paraburkholderia bannensis TaxID=765414 RepID=UPI002ABD40C5|nr:hypothetical protein [Paraburkholderia bannensis]
MDIEIGMAEMAGQLLRGEVLVNLDEWSIPLAIRNYLGSDSVASNVDSLKGILVEELGPEMMSDMSFGEDYITRLVGGDPLESRPKSPMQNIAVVHAVFGSWTALAEYIPSGNPVLDGERRLGRKKSKLASTPVYKMNKMEFSNHLKGLSEVELQEVIDGNRLWFLETLEIFPDITLDDLNRGERNRINQMIDWDRGFIDERLPLAGMMSEVEKKSKQERIDELVARIYFLRDANIRADPCRKIMKSHLVLNGRAVSKSLEIAESEEVMKAFGDCIDTHETHLARVAVHMSYLARKLRPNSLWADESSWSGLSPKNLAARIGTIKKWERTAGQ